MAVNRTQNRRSFLTRIIGAASACGALATLVGSAQAQSYTGVTDCDSGASHDNAGYGRGQHTAWTDQDTAPNADLQCRGRGPGARPEGAPS
jgi:hypothetical protein